MCLCDTISGYICEYHQKKQREKAMSAKHTKTVYSLVLRSGRMVGEYATELEAIDACVKVKGVDHISAREVKVTAAPLTVGNVECDVFRSTGGGKH